MTIYEDRPTLDERYARAATSAHLELLPTRCSVDYLIAAGWCRDDLGVKLFRLKSEFDLVRGDFHQAATNAHDDQACADELLRKSFVASDEEIAALRKAEADLAYKVAEEAAATARALILMRLPSLYETLQALHKFSDGFAFRQRFPRRPGEVERITARALELWIDPHCPSCGGRGSRGGFTSPLQLCTDCDHTGNRAVGPRWYRLDQTPVGHQFGRGLMTEMDRMTENVGRAMSRFLRQQEGQT